MTIRSLGAVALLSTIASAVADPQEHYGPPAYGDDPPAEQEPPTDLDPVGITSLEQTITEEALAKKAKELNDIAYSTPNGNRVMGSEGYEKTLDWITGYLDQMSDYYTYEIQPFPALFSNSGASLSVDDEEVEDAASFEYAPGGEADADIVVVENLGCEAGDYPEGVADNIALISRGDCPFGTKSALAGNAGALAAIIYNNVGGALSGTLGAPPNEVGEYVPTVGISQEFGETLIESISGGDTVTALVETTSDIRNITTFNVIADTIAGDHDKTVVLGAHADSVFAGPGINDDGSGSIGLLETATQLANFSTTQAIRFCWWGAEEFGLIGSTYYVESLTPSELAQIRLYLNFDMIASPNYIYSAFDGDGSAFNLSGPPGSAQIESFFESWFEANDEPLLPAAFTGRTDYQAFADNGVASGGLFTGAEVEKTEEEAELFGGIAGESYDQNYHQAGDNYTNLNFEAFLTNTKAIAAAVAEYGTSVDSLPAGNNTMMIKRSTSVHSHPKPPRQAEGCGFHKHV